MKTIQNEKGIALVIVLILSLITLAMTAAMIYMATQGTRFSGLQKSYKTALEANIGGVETLEHIILLRNWTDINTFETAMVAMGADITTPISSPTDTNTDCWGTDVFGTPHFGIMAKIRTPTKDQAGDDQWSSPTNTTNTATPGCDSSLTIVAADNTTYDFTFTLGTAPAEYNVYAKIVNTVEGNASMNTNLKKTGTDQNAPAVPHLGYLYSIEVLSVAALNPRERAKTSVLYEY